MEKRLLRISYELGREVSANIVCTEWHSSIVLEGTVGGWDQVVKAGKIAANRGYKGVVNRIQVEDMSIPEIKRPVLRDNILDGKRVDVLIIGSGIIGCAIARELSKWDISVLLLDKEDDVAMHASSRNDGMVHPGIEPKTGSKKAVFNVRGNKLYTKVTAELDVPFERRGSIILYNKHWMRVLAPLFRRKARLNGVEGVKALSYDEVRMREPNIAPDIAGGILLTSTGVLSPYKMTIAYAENALLNGAQLSLSTMVESIERDKSEIVSVKTNRGVIYPKIVINAAGIYADKIADMAGDQFFTIHPRKGEVLFLDKKKGYLLNSVIAKPDLKTIESDTKGGGLVKTIDGNILVGPDAYEQPFREDYSTNSRNIQRILKKHMPLIPALSPSDVITYCAGTRAATYEEDFIIEQSDYVKNLVYAAGIQSPGLASAPAIAEEIEKITCSILSEMREVKLKSYWNPYRKGIPELHKMSNEERIKAIRQRPDYGEIICRCEEISRGEIIDAIHSPIPVSTVDGIKRRVRAGMGRCQGGFCLPKVVEVIHEETGIGMASITKKGSGSNILVEETKKESGNPGGE